MCWNRSLMSFNKPKCQEFKIPFSFMGAHTSVPQHRWRTYHARLVLHRFWQHFQISGPRARFCQSPVFSPSIYRNSTKEKEPKQSRAFSPSPKWKCHSQEFQMPEITSSVFISSLYKSQNRIPLKGLNPTTRFKRRTNNFLTWVLRFRFQGKCRVNQMWKYRRVMNIS